MNGATCNDAFHISSPSPQAEGLTAAIESVMKGQDKSEFASICVHGTATLYNDQMESKAIQRAGLSDIPLSALKGYYGHTMGAAGVLETILTMYATDDGIVLPSKGFTELGVSGDVRINMSPQPLSGGEKNAFLKILSGFGGCNVAAIYKKGFDNEQLKTDLRTLSAHLDAKASRNILRSDQAQVEQWRASHTVRITPTEVSVDGQRIPTSEIGEKMLTEIYNKQIGNYPKFNKMDILSRLAFVAAELLKLPSNSPVEGERHEVSPSSEGLEGSPIILFNHSSSIVADRQFLSTISDTNNFFPSPSVFVYTLPNIAAGELAIRHHCPGETSFYILPEKNDDLMQQILKASHLATNTTSVISGWIDAESETTFECNLSLIEK